MDGILLLRLLFVCSCAAFYSGYNLKFYGKEFTYLGTKRYVWMIIQNSRLKKSTKDFSEYFTEVKFKPNPNANVAQRHVATLAKAQGVWVITKKILFIKILVFLKQGQMTLSIIIVNCYQLTCWGQQTFEADTLCCYEAEECNGDYSSAITNYHFLQRAHFKVSLTLWILSNF